MRVRTGWTISVPGWQAAKAWGEDLARTAWLAGLANGPTEHDGNKDGSAAPGTTSVLWKGPKDFITIFCCSYADFFCLQSHSPGLSVRTVSTLFCRLVSSHRNLNALWHSSSSQPAIRVFETWNKTLRGISFAVVHRAHWWCHILHFLPSPQMVYNSFTT